MKILAIEREVKGVAPDQCIPHLKAEANQAWKLYQSGVIRELHFRSDRSYAVLILECANIREAKKTLATLPLVREGLIIFELIPLKAYPGFQRLFVR